MIAILKKIAFSSISIRLFSVAFGFLGSVLVNRILGVELRGEYTTIYTYANLIQAALNLGVAYSFVPLKNKIGDTKARAALATFSWIQFILCIIGTTVFLFFSFSMENLFICALMSAMILNGQMTFIALIEDIRSRNLILLTSSILYVIANFFIILFLKKAIYCVLVCLIAKYLLESLLCAKRNALFRCKIGDLSIAHIKTILKYGIPTALLAVLITLNYNIDVILLNNLNAGNYQIGLFGVAYTLSNMLWFIPDAFKEYVYNKSAETELAGLTIVLIAENMLICIAICFLFLLFGKAFLVFFFGPEFEAAFSVTLTVFFGIIPMVAFKLIHPIYVNAGRSLIVAIFLMISVGINTVIAVFLIPAHGAFGAALATVASYSLCGGMFCIKYIKDYKIKKADIKKSYIVLCKALKEN